MITKKEIKIGILGMTEGNGHPYSWSAMFNGYNKKYMDECPYPVIPQYLYKQPAETFGCDGAKITHICCTGYEGIERARHIALASNIENVVERPEDMIGQVDAVICATDVGSEHVERCRPFMDANIPMFIDKPLVDNEEDLRTFVEWKRQGKKFISGSSMRYVKDLEPYHNNNYELGKLMYICQPMPKIYETYGIHALESIYPILKGGFKSIINTGTYERAALRLTHENGCIVDIVQGKGMAGAGTLLIGSAGSKYIQTLDSYYAFKKQLDKFVHFLRTDEEPFPFEETIELMKLVVLGLRSRDEGGVVKYLDEIKL